MHQNQYIWLASASPRRKELLDQVRIPFRQIVPDVDETKFSASSCEELVTMLAQEKALAAKQKLIKEDIDIHPIIAADTLVTLGAEPLGKPRNRNEAVTMLSRLSGRQHSVFTAVVVATSACVYSEVVETRVFFKALSATEIEGYCDSGEPFDKAGAYGIQGQAGAFVTRMEGSYSAVVGLPLFETVNLLSKVRARQ